MLPCWTTFLHLDRFRSSFAWVELISVETENVTMLMGISSKSSDFLQISSEITRSRGQIARSQQDLGRDH